LRDSWRKESKSEMPSATQRDGMANEFVIAIGRLPNRGRRAVRYASCRPITKLIRKIKTEARALITCPNAQKVPILVGDERTIAGRRERAFIKNVAGTDGPAVLEIASGAEFIVPTGLPVQHQRDIFRNDRNRDARLMNRDGVQTVPA